uniref:Uncharacterized protein n=1 Tax=Eutreptiella gymnastica TaxID=73025 RepID=A0A7S4CEK0_9EUGL
MARNASRLLQKSYKDGIEQGIFMNRRGRASCLSFGRIHVACSKLKNVAQRRARRSSPGLSVPGALVSMRPKRVQIKIKFTIRLTELRVQVRQQPQSTANGMAPDFTTLRGAQNSINLQIGKRCRLAAGEGPV